MADAGLPVPIDHHYQSLHNITAKPQVVNANNSTSNPINSTITNNLLSQKNISSLPRNATNVVREQHQNGGNSTALPQSLSQQVIQNITSNSNTKIDQRPSTLNSQQIILKQNKERILNYMKTLKNAKQQTHLLMPMDYIFDKKQMLLH